MKIEGTKRLYSKWFHVIHYIFIAIVIVLVIVLPVVYTKTGTPPFWSIWLIFGVLLLIYMLYRTLLFILERNLTKATTALGNSNSNSTHDHIVNMPYGDETLGLQISTSTMQTEDDDGNDVETLETSYNPSTVGIPPSSFLAPTINQQASIRSSSLEYTSPPPAYQDMIYPPSYRSTNSIKDDNTSIIQSINNSNNNNM